jgi:chromosome segregation ATPase
MTELNTTREERSEAFELTQTVYYGANTLMNLTSEMSSDIDTLEDELASVREELSKSDSMVITANEQAIRYREERDRLREELNRSKDYVDELKDWGKTVVQKLEDERDAYATRNAEVLKERDKLREELESARLFIDCYLMAGEQETGKALANYIARFGGRE